MKSLEEIKNEMKFGSVMTIKEFADDVKHGCIIDYDGTGYYHDGNEETKYHVNFDYKSIMSKAKKYPYVCWYNR